VRLPPVRPGDGVISSSFWASWNTPTDWTEIDIFELGGGAPGGPGPGFPFIMFMNMHVFRRTGTSFTPATVLSQPGNYVHSEPLANRYHVYGLDWCVGGGGWGGWGGGGGGGGGDGCG